VHKGERIVNIILNSCSLSDSACLDTAGPEYSCPSVFSLCIGGVGELDGIKTASGEQLFPGLINSFEPHTNSKKTKILGIIFGIILVAEIVTYLTVSWQNSAREIPFSVAAIDLGEFAPRARKAPVIEVDDVFGNQFVKEKKEASALPANEAGGSIDGEGVIDLDVAGAGGGSGAPNIARCAVRNFPPEAKAHVEEALVLMSILVDKSGLVREAKPLYVNFPKALPPELKDRMKKLFMNAGRASLQGRRCPVYYAGGVAVGYRLEVPLSYELYN
jgi:hypothetical protein